jgi:hypothetical protein
LQMQRSFRGVVSRMRFESQDCLFIFALQECANLVMSLAVLHVGANRMPYAS